VAVLVTLPGLRGLACFWRRDGLDPDGAPISREAEAELLRLVGEACAAIGAATPARVHTSLDHGVWISGRGGDPTLVIGAPVVDTLPGEALRVAVAHAALRARQLDRSLDRWARCVVDTVAAWAGIPVAGAPWRWLARRIRPVVAEAQRSRVLLADAHCARTFGADAAAAWARVGAREDAFAAYWMQDVVPVLDAGFRPPVLDGWRQFLGREWVAETITTSLADDLHDVPAPDDPRPSLGMRLAAIEASSGAVAGGAGGERVALHTVPTELEAAALREMHRAEGRVLVELPWERVGGVVWLPRLHAAMKDHAKALAGLTPADLRRLASSSTADDAIPSGVLGAALAVALVEAGWQLDAGPGLPLCVRSEDHELLVMDVGEFLRDADDSEWGRFLEAAGLERHALAPRPWEASAPAASADTFTATAMLSLPQTRRRRRTTALLLAAGIPIWLMGCLGLLLVLLTSPIKPVVPLVGFPLFAVQGWWLHSRARIGFRKGSLSVASGGVRIEDRGLLQRPLLVERSRIRRVVIDDRDTRSTAGAPLRFPFGPSQWLHPSRPELGATGWLWSGAHDRSVPMLGAGDETPNVLLVFDDPIDAPGLRHYHEGLPLAGHQLAGLAVCVGDTEAAEKAFAGWGVTRILSETEAKSMARRRGARL